MPLELWILLALAAAAALVGGIRRITRASQRERAAEPKNVYPLW